ncbi:MAG: hypothetical protein IPJ79_11215 [Bacteroidetes bacterium]|nr:hypothetical protein [Bacteroidota bacterium]
MNPINLQAGPIRKYVLGALAVAAFLFFLFGVKQIVEDVDAKEIVVIQAPFTGTLNVYTTPGTKMQMFGTVTRYKKSFQYWFDGKENHGAQIPIKFYDGGHANIPGSIRVDMPLDEPTIIKNHVKYGSQDAIESQLVAPVLTKAVYFAGPTMTSKESYAEKKNDLLYYVEDQATHGVYKTRQKEVRATDPLTGQERTMTAVEIVLGANGKPLRQEESAVIEAKIRLSNLSFGDFVYDDVVKQQIAVQQQAIMQVQTAIANAKRAEQDAITVEQQGKADAAKAKWDKEVIKAQAVTEAEQKRDVAKLNAEAEEQNKRANILKGEGEAAYKRLVTQANNNLELKLEAYKEVQKNWAEAFSKFQGNLVPSYVSGNSGNNSNAINWMEIMGMKAAKDLNLDLKPDR